MICMKIFPCSETVRPPSSCAHGAYGQVTNPTHSKEGTSQRSSENVGFATKRHGNASHRMHEMTPR